MCVRMFRVRARLHVCLSILVAVCRSDAEVQAAPSKSTLNPNRTSCTRATFENALCNMYNAHLAYCMDDMWNSYSMLVIRQKGESVSFFTCLQLQNSYNVYLSCFAKVLTRPGRFPGGTHGCVQTGAPPKKCAHPGGFPTQAEKGARLKQHIPSPRSGPGARGPGNAVRGPGALLHGREAREGHRAEGHAHNEAPEHRVPRVDGQPCSSKSYQSKNVCCMCARACGFLCLRVTVNLGQKGRNPKPLWVFPFSTEWGSGNRKRSSICWVTCPLEGPS